MWLGSEIRKIIIKYSLLSKALDYIYFRVYQETLACYDDFAKQKGLSCTAAQLHNFQLNATSLAYYATRPYSECDSSPERSVYDQCAGN